MQLVGVEERRPSGPDDRCGSLNSDCERAADHHKQLFVHVPVGRVRRATGCERGLVSFQVIPGVGQTIKDCPGLVLPILLYRQFAVGLDERAQGRDIRRKG